MLQHTKRRQAFLLEKLRYMLWMFKPVYNQQQNKLRRGIYPSVHAAHYVRNCTKASASFSQK